MTRFLRGLVVVLVGIAFGAAVCGTCPCAPTAAAGPGGHGCCTGEAGLRAAPPECCGGEAVAPRVSITGPAFVVTIGLLPRAPFVTAPPIRAASARILVPSASSPSSVLRI